MTLAALTATVLAVALTGCGEKKDKPAASQTAAKVNKEEITVHQINFVLQQQRGLAPEQAASASKVALERLIDQELALQKAQDQKLDRDPRVVQQLEAARREIIARAYVDKIAAGAPKPSAAEIKAYYEAHPALFKERRVYNLQELAIQARPEQVAELQAKLGASKDVPDFVNYLKANDFKFAANQAVRGAEQLPLASLDRFAQLKDGQTIFSATPTGAQVVIMAGARSQPVDEAHAVPAIEQFLWNERKRKVIEDDVKALRGAAKIEYVGDYAKGGSKEVKPPPPAASEAPPLTSVAPAMPAGSIPSAAPQVEVEPINTAPASSPTTGTLEKGIKGFK
ncbi:MAG TPA: EpsD family peptidyl-prolyl cis-trans isomerase [Burkholderiaceae bacterium]|nr:EpsD family peptidyl-prolyl cis-trans isomerase [Burkholderiaceae bacterium]